MQSSKGKVNEQGTANDSAHNIANDDTFCIPVKELSESYAESIFGRYNFSTSTLCNKFPADDWTALITFINSKHSRKQNFSWIPMHISLKTKHIGERIAQEEP